LRLLNVFLLFITYAQLDGTPKSKCLILYTKYILDPFLLILQDCRYLLQAAESGDVSSVKMLVNSTDVSCITGVDARNAPLTYAAENGHVDVVRVLLESGANLEATNHFQRTALHEAAYEGHLEVCRLLLDWGAKVDPLDNFKYSPLHDAAQKGHLSVVKLLVEMGADVTMTNFRSLTAEGEARIEGRGVVADWLDSVGRV
jgi:ankyrin repeat protein